MSQFITRCMRRTAIGFASAVLALSLVAGCAGGPSKEELSRLDERRKAVAAAETRVADLKADKARLERKLAEKKAALKKEKENQEAVRVALSGAAAK